MIDYFMLIDLGQTKSWNLIPLKNKIGKKG